VTQAEQCSLTVSTEKSILRWAGLAGIMGVVIGILSLLAVIFAPPLFVTAGPNCGPPCSVDASLQGFPAAKAAIVAENALYFVSVILFVILFLGLYRALRMGSSLGPAFFGLGLTLMRWALEAIGALPSVAFAHLSEVYSAAGPQDQATLVLVSHAVQSVFNATDTVGGILLGTGYLLFGLAMYRSTIFGKKIGIATIILSIAALVGIGVVSIGMDNPNDLFFVIPVLVLPLLLGWKIYMLSKS
jgi:Domain of unknown function (DUF4386)